MPELLLFAVGAAMVVGAAYDATTLTIPNWISLALLALFPVVVLAAGVSWTEAGIHVGVGVAALVAGIALFAAGAIGGGDAKLFAAVSLYVGLAWFGAYVMAVAIAGGALAMTVMAIRWAATTSLGSRMALVQHLTRANAGIPYGVAIAAGGLFVLPSTHLFLSVAQ